jgi:hypothetical protein
MFAISFQLTDMGISRMIWITLGAGVERMDIMRSDVHVKRSDADLETTILRRIDIEHRSNTALPRTCVFISRDHGLEISVSSGSRSARKEWFLKCLGQDDPVEYTITPPQKVSPANYLERLKRAEQEMNRAALTYETTLKRVHQELDNARLSYEDTIKKIRRERFAPKSRRVRISATAICRTKYLSLNDGSEKSVVVEDTDLRTLDDGTWVNDVIISYFIYEFIPLNADILVLDCQFFANLKMYKELHGNDFAAYQKYRGLSRMVYWPGFKYIQIPVNMDSHWSFVVLEQLDRGVYAAVHIDSLCGMHDKRRVTSVISTYLRHEYQHKYNMRAQGITTTTSAPCNPQQGNGYDCGAFVMYYMLKVNKALHKMEEKVLQTVAIESCRGLSQSKCAGFRELLRNLLTGNESD